MDDGPVGVAALLRRMEAVHADLAAAGDARRHFLGTYLRTTRAVSAALDAGRFEDPAWVARWDVDFAGLYLDALETYPRDPASVRRPWRIAFAADPALPPEAHVLLGMNAHVNDDLPRSLLAVIPAAGFDDPGLLALRRRDHERIDGVLAARVAAEDVELRRSGGRRTPLDRVLAPVNRAASRRFLREARVQVWHNALELHAARVRSQADGGADLADRLRDLEVLVAARVHDVLRPGPVILRLAVAGFGVRLPPA